MVLTLSVDFENDAVFYAGEPFYVNLTFANYVTQPPQGPGERGETSNPASHKRMLYATVPGSSGSSTATGSQYLLPFGQSATLTKGVSMERRVPLPPLPGTTQALKEQGKKQDASGKPNAAENAAIPSFKSMIDATLSYITRNTTTNPQTIPEDSVPVSSASLVNVTKPFVATQKSRKRRAPLEYRIEGSSEAQRRTSVTSPVSKGGLELTPISPKSSFGELKVKTNQIQDLERSTNILNALTLSPSKETMDAEIPQVLEEGLQTSAQENPHKINLNQRLSSVITSDGQQDVVQSPMTDIDNVSIATTAATTVAPSKPRDLTSRPPPGRPRAFSNAKSEVASSFDPADAISHAGLTSAEPNGSPNDLSTPTVTPIDMEEIAWSFVQMTGQFSIDPTYIKAELFESLQCKIAYGVESGPNSAVVGGGSLGQNPKNPNEKSSSECFRFL